MEFNPVKKLMFFIILSMCFSGHSTCLAQNTERKIKEIKFELLGGDYFYNKFKVINPDETLHNVNNSISFKYPSTDNYKEPLYYMALKIDDSTTLTNINIYNFPTKKGTTKLVTPYPENSQTLGVNNVCPNHVLLGIAPGMIFLEKRTTSNTWFLLKYFNKSFDALYEGDQFPTFYQITDLDTLLFSIPKKNGIYEINNNRIKRNPLITGKIISFDQFEDMFLINDYNQDDNADINFIKLDNKTKYPIAVHDKIEAYYPQFSQTGKYVAYIQNRQQNRNVWDLVVKEISLKNNTFTFETKKIIKNINIYHMKVTAFFYEGTFQWFDDILFYQTKNNKKPHITAFLPEKNTYWELYPDVESKLHENHLDKKSKVRTLIVHLSEICLFNIAKKNGKWHMITECLVKLYEKNNFESLERRRIAIYREK